LVINLPLLAVQPARAATSLSASMKQVDQALDTAVRDLNAAEEQVNKKHLTGIDKPMELVRDAEAKIGQAMSMFKTVEATKPTKDQIEQIRQVLRDAQAQLRQASTLLERTGQKTMPYKLVRGLVTGADKQVGKAMKTLQQVAAAK
jgi:cytolysin (calcineurin-like family phosphatase)